MKVLFVYRAYGEEKSNSVIDFQRVSLEKEGVEIENFHITDGGIKGYLKSIKSLKEILRKKHYDVIHAHYVFSGFIAKLASKNPVVCSLMGSDVFQQSFKIQALTKYFYQKRWNATIVKSTEMLQLFPKAKLIPNGVDFRNFKSIDKKIALQKGGFSTEKQNVIFVAQDTSSAVKNLALAQKSIHLLNDDSIELNLISGKSFKELPYYFNAADLLVLTSISEGSPNVIKEAMACNLPIVSTNVGDVKQVLKNTKGTYICSFNPEDVAEKIKLALDFGERTSGREKISHLSSEVIAKQIISLYKSVIDE